MKRRFAILFSLLLALCLIGTLLPASALAAETISLDSVYLSETAPTVEANHIYLDGYCTDCGLPEGMTYTVYGDSVTINRYNGSLKEVVIPATIEGKSVTKIGSGAFGGTTVEKVIIPEGVITIDDFAFSNGYYSLKEVVFPSTVTEIGEDAFFRCYGLTEITLPAGLKKIGIEAFGRCFNLRKITMPDGLVEISKGAFNGCIALTEVSIPDSVKIIGPSAFHSCESLTKVTLPSGIEAIEKNTFRGCTSLQQITIPASVTSIGEMAFHQCSALTRITFKGDLPSFGSECFDGSSTIGAYPCGNGTWTDTAIADLAAAHPTVTWVAAHTPVEGYCTGCGETSFADIPEDSWQYPFAQYAVRNGLMAGKGTDADGNIIFDPNNPIKREEFVQVLYNAEGKPAISIDNPFPDVADGGWYKNAVLWAKQNDIASGKGNGNFGVGENISRQDLAMMLYKYAKLKGYSLEATNGLINQFADGANVASYATGAMDWAVTNGIMSGKGAAGADLSSFRLDPTGIATRAECAAMLKNFQTAFGG